MTRPLQDLAPQAAIGWRRRIAPLGIATDIAADDPDLLATILAAYAEWPDVASAPAIELRFVLGSDTSEAVDVNIRVDGSRLSLTGPGVAGHADARTGRAVCIVPRRLVGDPAAMAAEVSDTLLLFLLARSGRTPVHAAGVLLGDTVLVLAGPSGSGKSTLALAAAGRGLQILSDDTLYIQLRPRQRVWGFSRPLHLFPEDAPRFIAARRLRGGKLKAVVPVPVGATGASFADKAALILLRRGERLGLTRLDADEAARGLARLDPGFDLLAEESAAAARALAAGGGWRLTLGRDPGAAIDFLVANWRVAEP